MAKPSLYRRALARLLGVNLYEELDTIDSEAGDRLRVFLQDAPPWEVEMMVYREEDGFVLSHIALSPEDAIILGTTVKSVGYKAVDARNAAGRVKETP